MADLELLQYTGVATYELSVKLAYPALTRVNADGYGHTVRYGNANGLKQWTLQYGALYTDENCPMITLADDTQTTPKEYLFDFIKRHHTPDIKLFRILCPEDNTEYTASFLTHEFDWNWIDLRLWSTGLTVIQRRLPSGLQAGPNPSLVSDNPLSI